MKSYKEIALEEVDSTNKYLIDNRNIVDSFTFVSAKYQIKGRGRNDRSWLSDKGDSLLFSLLIKDEDIVKKGGYLSLITACSIAKILIENYHLEDVKIKWPNDIYVGEKKICGILLEGNIPHYIVIGVGLNINQEKFVGEYRREPTSIYLEKHYKNDINLVKNAVFAELFENLTTEKDYLSYYQNHDYLKGKLVKVLYNNEVVIGVVLGVDNNFNLILKNKEKEYLISSGEIEIL